MRQITETLGQLDWNEAQQATSWLYVRSWLLGWSQVMRVWQDYRFPADQIQQAVELAQAFYLLGPQLTPPLRRRVVPHVVSMKTRLYRLEKRQLPATRGLCDCAQAT